MDDFIDYNGGYLDGGMGDSQSYMQPPVTQLSDAARAMIYNPPPPPGAHDVKPRLNKHQHDFLEAEFQKHPKPTTMVKKEFAHNLGVTLDKVNNWFQNRRAKSKHDVKKQTAAYNLYQSNVNSDTEPSPFQPSNEYAAMMQHLGPDGYATNGLGIASQPQQSHEVERSNMTAYLQDASLGHQMGHFTWEQDLPTENQLYEMSTVDNRRTLTQETFDEISRNGGMLNGQGHFEGLQSGFSGDQDMMNQIFGNQADQQMKAQDLSFPYPSEAPLSSNDSTIPSVVSDRSYQFPMNNSMQPPPNAAVNDPGWTDSRSSSLSVLQHQGMMAPAMPATQPQPNAQWQPGSSVPVDPSKHLEEFRQAAQSRAPEQHQTFEQPLAFPTDAAYARRASQATMLTQSMGNVNIHTPQPDQAGMFKSPAPNSSIAARRQRPKPANLGVAALRSASYSGAAQPGSPGHGVPQTHLTQDQHIRRIRSAVAMNGGVAHGRVMKSTPGSAQRSPVNWTFSNGMVSPSFTRTMSHGNLAPPTPMSPHEYYEQFQLLQQQQASHMSQHHPSISETDEQGLPYQPSASVPPQKFSSPPHTPMYYDHPLMAQRMNGHIIPENTPPQSAPAGQTCFPSNVFASVPQQHHQPPSHFHANSVQMQAPPIMQRPVPPPQPAPIVVEQPKQPSHPPVTFAPSQQSNVTTGPPPGVPLQFANGIPTVTTDGTVKMSFPPQAQLMQQQSAQMSTPPQQQYAFVTTSGDSPSSLSTAGTPQQRGGELFVHEYSPPDGTKRSTIPRKPVEVAPKNYTFANHGPVDFEEKSRMKKAGSEGRDSVSGWSPSSSSSGTASTL